MEIRDDIWLERRLWTELVRLRAGYKCEKCGATKEELGCGRRDSRLTSHHVDHDQKNNTLQNGVCWCSSCHQKYHASFPREGCKPGCTCKRHNRAWNKLELSDLCKYGHNNWYIDKRGYKKCRECRKASLKKLYYSNAEYRQRQIDKTTERRRALRGGGE